MSANLLVELFTEELPPKALKRLGDAFAGGIVEGLKSGGLLDATSRSKAFATPRRLAVYILAVLAKGRDRPVEQKLMPAAVARKADGGWSDALRRKLAGMGRGTLADAPVNTRVGTDIAGRSSRMERRTASSCAASLPGNRSNRCLSRRSKKRSPNCPFRR